MANYTGRKVLLKDENDNAIIPYVDSVVDQNTSVGLKTWTGTKAQYDALTKDSNTLYHITDEESSIINTINDLINANKNLLESIYPVGSVYLSTSLTCPLASLISGSSWEQVGSSIITSVNTSVPVKGNGYPIGLIDGNGNEGSLYQSASYGLYSGDYTATALPVKEGGNSGTSRNYGLHNDSSKSGIVGTVTRTSISVYIFKRTA